MLGNLYAFGGNNPGTFVDPMGLEGLQFGGRQQGGAKPGDEGDVYLLSKGGEKVKIGKWMGLNPEHLPPGWKESFWDPYGFGHSHVGIEIEIDGLKVFVDLRALHEITSGLEEGAGQEGLKAAVMGYLIKSGRLKVGDDQENQVYLLSTSDVWTVRSSENWRKFLDALQCYKGESLSELVYLFRILDSAGDVSSGILEVLGGTKLTVGTGGIVGATVIVDGSIRIGLGSVNLFRALMGLEKLPASIWEILISKTDNLTEKQTYMVLSYLVSTRVTSRTQLEAALEAIQGGKTLKDILDLENGSRGEKGSKSIKK